MVLLAGVFALMMLATGSAALAKNNGDDDEGKRVTVSGDSTFSDCGGPESALALQLFGDLEGCWEVFPQRFKCKELNGFAWYREWGNEAFVGALHGEEGEFKTRYRLTAIFEQGFCGKFEDDPAAFLTELAGGCIHKIRGKSGVFDDAKGLITFFDLIPNLVFVDGDPPSVQLPEEPLGGTNFPYVGRLILENDFDDDDDDDGDD